MPWDKGISTTLPHSMTRGKPKYKTLYGCSISETRFAEVENANANLADKRASSAQRSLRPTSAVKRGNSQGRGSPEAEKHRKVERFGANAAADLYFQFALTPKKESGAPTFHAETYIPTQSAQAVQEARIPHAHEDPGRPESSFPPSRQGAQAGLSEARFPRIGGLSPCLAGFRLRQPVSHAQNSRHCDRQCA